MIDRYTRPEMARLWSEEARLGRWLEVELALVEVLAERGEVPRRGGARRSARRARVDVARMQAIEAEVKHDVIAFVSSVAETRRRRGPLPPPRPHVVATWSTRRSRSSCATPPTCCSPSLDRLRGAVRAQAAAPPATRP